MQPSRGTLLVVASSSARPRSRRTCDEFGLQIGTGLGEDIQRCIHDLRTNTIATIRREHALQ